MARRTLSGTRLDRRRAPLRSGRSRPARSLARARAHRPPAARRRRRRAYAPALAAAPAGRPHRGPPRAAGARMRPRALSECRAQPAPAGAARANLSARAARRDLARRRAVRTIARRASLRISGGAGTGGRDARDVAAQARRGRPCLALSRRRARQRQRARRARARADRRSRLRALFSHRPRHRPVRARAQDPLPGARLGGQLGGVLRARDHRGRSGPDVDALRALPLARAKRASRHRRRLRASATRRGHPVHLCEVRPRPGGDRRHGDHLSPEERDPRRRQSARPRSGAGRRPREIARLVGSLADRPGQARRRRLRRGEPGHPAALRDRAMRWSASRGTSPSTPAGSSSPAGRSSAWCRSRTRRCRSAA